MRGCKGGGMEGIKGIKIERIRVMLVDLKVWVWSMRL